MKRLSSSLIPFLIVLIITGCANQSATLQNPTLHVIGVYEGKTPANVDDRPWWAKCKGNPTECFNQYAGNSVEKNVVVNISYNASPIVLALMAYDRTHWIISLKNGATIKSIILAGYESQRVTGAPADTLIKVYTYESSPCDRCWQGTGYFYSYESAPSRLEKITGLKPSSFQGRYKGDEFSIFPGIENTKH